MEHQETQTKEAEFQPDQQVYYVSKTSPGLPMRIVRHAKKWHGAPKTFVLVQTDGKWVPWSFPILTRSLRADRLDALTDSLAMLDTQARTIKAKLDDVESARYVIKTQMDALFNPPRMKSCP